MKMDISSLNIGLLELTDSELFQKIRQLRFLRRQMADVKTKPAKKTKKIKKQSNTEISKMTANEKAELLKKLLKIKQKRK